MILYPAVDLKDGQCVRLLRGDMDSATVFNAHPAEQAAAFEAAGFGWLHLVDLNGAFAGRPVNAAAVKAILGRVRIPVQLGGGIRNMESIAIWLEAGVSRVILGTAALRNPMLVKEACRLFPDQIAVGIDAREGKVAVAGWADVSDQDAVAVALRFEDAGAAAIVYTDIARDGAMQGANVEETARFAERLTTPVIASGGIATLDDLRALKELEAVGVEGAIIGRALYEGSIRAKEALNIT